MQFECAPVLLINFCRPDFTKAQIDRLREIKPKQVFMAVDGPRPGRESDIEVCKAVRALAKDIDWPCKIKTLFQGENLGCKYAPPAAITWFFENVESGIILEDDVCPTPEFFRFATELLERYRDDERVGMIAGFNRYNIQTDAEASYHFNAHPDIWGWGTWRRVWRNYDVELHDAQRGQIASIRLATRRGRHDFLCGIKAVGNGLQTWDYQFGLMFMMREYLSATPKEKLVANHGVNECRGSNTTGYMFDSHYFNTPGTMHFPLVHPAEITADIRKMRQEELREFGIIPRAITWLGCKIPSIIPLLETVGRFFERLMPLAFKI